MFKRFLIALGLAGSMAVPATAIHAAGPGCNYVLGFATLANMIPDQAGRCADNEFFNTSNGDEEQHTTTGGLLVWRKADNWTAFTDGYHTWINGPNGLEQRLNSDRFPWEPATSPTPPPAPAPAAAALTDTNGPLSPQQMASVHVPKDAPAMSQLTPDAQLACYHLELDMAIAATGKIVLMHGDSPYCPYMLAYTNNNGGAYTP